MYPILFVKNKKKYIYHKNWMLFFVCTMCRKKVYYLTINFPHLLIKQNKKKIPIYFVTFNKYINLKYCITSESWWEIKKVEAVSQILKFTRKLNPAIHTCNIQNSNFSCFFNLIS